MKNLLFSRASRWLWRLAKIAIVVAIIAAVIYWFRFQPVKVDVHNVTQAEAVAEVLGTGTLEARVQATISPKIAGLIRSIRVDEGDRVTEGQLLVQLDDAELRQQVAIAEADAETKRASISRLNADISRTAAVLKQAKSNYDRLKDLVEQNAVSRDELDKAVESVSIAEADSARADAAIAEARKALVVAQRTLEYQKTKLEDSKVAAPFDGLIVRRTRDPGDVVVAGAPVLLLISTDELWVSAWVDETEMSRVKQGQSANVIFRSESSNQLPGEVARLGKETDRETREFIVEVSVKKLPENWAVGQRAEVYIETSRKSDAIMIPTRFLARTDGRTGVFLNQNGFVAWQPVEVGLRGRDQIEIISGLEVGQQVIVPVKPQRPLRAGQRIVQP